MSIASNGLSSGARAALAHASQVAPTAVQKHQGKGQYELQKLRARHHLILRMSAQGMDNKEISSQLNLSEVAVSYTINSELGQQRLEVLMGNADIDAIDMIKEFAELAPVALEVAEEVMLNPYEKTSDRLNAVDKILNGAGYGKKVDLGISVQLVGDNEIRAAKELARKKGKLAGIIVEDAVIVSESDEEDTEG